MDQAIAGMAARRFSISPEDLKKLMAPGELRCEGGPHFILSPSPFGRGLGGVQTGNIVYRINRAHGLHCVGQEEGADAVEGNQCHGPENSVDSRLVEW